MKSLRSRVLFVVTLAALIPVTTVGLWARHNLRERAEREHARLLAATVASTRREIDERNRALQVAIDNLCQRDGMGDTAAMHLATGAFEARGRRELEERVPALVRGLALDSLEVLDGSNEAGAIVGSSHSARLGTQDGALLLDAMRAHGETFVRTAPGRSDARGRDGRALLASCAAERTGARVVVVGGRLLDPIVRELALNSAPAIVALAGPDGELSPDQFPDGAPRGARSEVHTFARADGTPEAKLIALVDDRTFQGQLDELDRGFLLAGGLGLLFAIACGIFLGIRMSRPLAELEHAASRVGAGDLESTIAFEAGGEVGRALGAFNHMTRELRATRERLLRAERIAAWRDIARRIAHEIKNPLSPIQVSIETMRKTYAKRHPDFDEIFEESTMTILEEVERLKRIVTEFSRFARLPRPRPAPLDVGEVIAHVVGLHASGDVAISVSKGAALPIVRADREQVTQVLVNLVQNACDAARSKHGPQGGKVIVSAEPEPEGIAISVSDNGPGLSPEERSRVFEPYYTTKAGGTGLGLAIVHRIVGDHGGSIEVLDSALGGATFRFTLPEAGPPAEADVSHSDMSGLPPLGSS